jgi:hypothetical protein
MSMKSLAGAGAAIALLTLSVPAFAACNVIAVHPGQVAFHFKCLEDLNNTKVYGVLNTQGNYLGIAATVNAALGSIPLSDLTLIPNGAPIPCNATICPGTPDAGGGGSAIAVNAVVRGLGFE